MAYLAAELVAVFDGALIELADGIAAEFQLPQSAVLEIFREAAAPARSAALRLAGRR